MSSASHDPTSYLNESHKQQLLNYMKFFRSRINDTQKEIAAAFDDEKDMRLLEEMYSVDDVKATLDAIRNIVQSNVHDEMDKWASQSSLFLRQLMLQAEGNAVQLQLDTHTLEDVELLAGLKKLELDSLKQKEVGEAQANSNARGKLNALSGATDIKLVTKVKDLEEANRSLLAKFDKLQIQCRTAMSENSELKDKNESLMKSVATLEGDMANIKSKNRDAQQAEIDNLRNSLDETKSNYEQKIKALEVSLKEANEAAAAKVNASPQFIQLKKMLVTKNQQLKEAREKVKALGGDN